MSAVSISESKIASRSVLRGDVDVAALTGTICVGIACGQGGGTASLILAGRFSVPDRAICGDACDTRFESSAVGAALSRFCIEDGPEGQSGIDFSGSALDGADQFRLSWAGREDGGVGGRVCPLLTSSFVIFPRP